MKFPRQTPGMSDREYERLWNKALKEAYRTRLSDPTYIADEILAGDAGALPRVTRRAGDDA